MMNENEDSFRHWLETNGIEGVLFDLDDTLIKTSEMFEKAVLEVINLYAMALPALDPKKIAEFLSEAKFSAYKRGGVSPEIWDIVVGLFEERVGLEKSLSTEALEIFASIYLEKPRFEEGAEKVLRLLKEWGFVVGLVTHANIEWTLFKLKSLGLEGYFDHIEIVDERRLFKSDDSWINGADKIFLPPSKVLVVGDNVKGDIQAAKKAGIGKTIWINKKTDWSKHHRGELPEGTTIVQKVGDLLSLLS